MDVKKLLLIVILFAAVKAQAQSKSDSTKTDSLLLKKIQEEMQQPQAPAAQGHAGASATRILV